MRTSFQFSVEDVKAILEDYIEKSGYILPEITEIIFRNDLQTEELYEIQIIEKV